MAYAYKNGQTSVVLRVKLIDSILADLMAHEAALLDGLGPGEQDDLRRILKRLLARFEPQAGDDAGKLGGMN